MGAHKTNSGELPFQLSSLYKLLTYNLEEGSLEKIFLQSEIEGAIINIMEPKKIECGEMERYIGILAKGQSIIQNGNEGYRLNPNILSEFP